MHVHFSNKFLHIVFSWMPLAFLSTLFCGLVYITVQQNLRSSANDPQIQMAEDTAFALTSGKSTQALLPREQIDIRKSLAPYIIIFDESGKPILSSAILDGKIPLPPGKLFTDIHKQPHEIQFTWEQQRGIRSAAVMTSYGNNAGFVLAGRSLREIEKRENNLVSEVFIVWIVSLLGTLSLGVVSEMLLRKNK